MSTRINSPLVPDDIQATVEELAADFGVVPGSFLFCAIRAALIQERYRCETEVDRALSSAKTALEAQFWVARDRIGHPEKKVEA